MLLKTNTFDVKISNKSTYKLLTYNKIKHFKKNFKTKR